MANLRHIRTFLLAIFIMVPLLQSTNQSVLTFGVVLVCALAAALIGTSIVYVLSVGGVRITRAFIWSALWFFLLITWSLLMAEDITGLERTLQWLGVLILFFAVAVYPVSWGELEMLTWVSGVAVALTVSLSIL